MLSRVHRQVRLVSSPYSAQDPCIECASLSVCIYQGDDPRHHRIHDSRTKLRHSPTAGRSIQYFATGSKTSHGFIFDLKRRHCTALVYYVSRNANSCTVEKSFSSNFPSVFLYWSFSASICRLSDLYWFKRRYKTLL